MASIASYLESQGYESLLILLERGSTRSISSFVGRLSKNSHDIVIAKINFQDHSILLPLLRHLKEDKLVKKIALCGPYASRNNISLIKGEKHVDGILVGQPECAALDFVNYCIDSGRPNLEEAQFTRRDEIDSAKIINPIFIKKGIPLNDLPLPKRTVEKIEVTPHANIEASRGCAFNCSFCHLNKSPLTYRSPKAVVDEIVYLNRSLGKSLFIFNDSCFWASASDNDRVKEIADRIVEASLDVRLYVYLRLRPLIPEPILSALVRAGLVRVFLGVESGVRRIQSSFNKITEGADFEGIRSHFEKNHGLNVHIGFITVEPTSSLNEVEQNIDYLMKIEKLFRLGIVVEPMRAIPGTEAYAQLVDDHQIQPGLEHDKITYGYTYKYPETAIFIRDMQHMFRTEIGNEAYKFEYYSTVVGLLKALAAKIDPDFPANVVEQFHNLIAIRHEGMLVLNEYFKGYIKNLRETFLSEERIKYSNASFTQSFGLIALRIEIAYGKLIGALELAGYSRAVREVYTGMEGIYA